MPRSTLRGTPASLEPGPEIRPCHYCSRDQHAAPRRWMLGSRMVFRAVKWESRQRRVWNKFAA
eukprot:12632570-Alexandrium_andersonii.AAC.1